MSSDAKNEIDLLLKPEGRRIMGWAILSGLSFVMLMTMMYWWNNYKRTLWLDGPVIIAQNPEGPTPAAGEPKQHIFWTEIVALSGISVWAASEAIGEYRNLFK